MATSKQSAERLTIKQIAERTSKSEKYVRHLLRKHFTRSDELKNARWGDAENGNVLSAEATEFLVARLSRKSE